MATFQHVRSGAIGAVALAVSMSGSFTTLAEHGNLAAEPPGSSRDEMGGQDAAGPSQTSLLAFLIPEPTWDHASGYGAVEANRAAASALIAGGARG